jgi:hypothetical protein
MIGEFVEHCSCFKCIYMPLRRYAVWEFQSYHETIWHPKQKRQMTISVIGLQIQTASDLSKLTTYTH